VQAYTAGEKGRLGIAPAMLHNREELSWSAGIRARSPIFQASLQFENWGILEVAEPIEFENKNFG
jgi:hypothetical protein